MIAPKAFTTAESGSDYFATEIHYRAVAERIAGAVRDDCRFIIVTGDLPPNPPTICASLNNALNQQRPVMVLTSRPEFRADELLLASRHLVAHKLASDTQPDALAPPLFIFDDAGQLADQQIEDVYEKSRSNAWIVVLLGHSDFLARLKQHDFPIRWDERTRFLRFDELGRSEIRQYIDQEIGASEAVHFNDDAVAVIWLISHGDPRIVNRLARRLLDAASKTADLLGPGLPLPPAPEPAHKAFDQSSLVDPEIPVVLPEASLPKLDAVTARSVAAADPPPADSETLFNRLAHRLHNANVSSTPYLPLERPVGSARDQPAGRNPAATPAVPEEPRKRPDAAIGADIPATDLPPADQDTLALAPASMSRRSGLATPASLLSWWRHATNLSRAIIAAVFCLVGAGLAGIVVLDLREVNAGPPESGTVGGSSPHHRIALATATKPPRTAPPAIEANAVPAPPSAASPPPAGPVPPPSVTPEENVELAPPPSATAPPAGPLPPPSVTPEENVELAAPPSATAPAAGPVPLPSVTLEENVELAPPPSATAPLPVGPAIPPVAAPVTLPEPAPPVAVEVAGLLEHGDALFATGDLVSARLLYERAAEAGNAQAALRLGESFDPDFLHQARIWGTQGDLRTAIIWYRRARELGSAEAEILLKSLEGN
jgi:hypothetical protein